MKKSFILMAALIAGIATSGAQQVQFEEYDLDNGLHVILHQDKTAPIVITSVMYHVGAKDEVADRTGFAHFFEHLLFEGTKNIDRGEWFKIVSSNGGTNNANTTADRTYYYEIFPSNNLKLGLWMESERLLHPIIEQIGVDTQNEVVKEEKRLRVDNSPYGGLLANVSKNLFKKHPYKGTVIGEMEHLDAASLDEFKAFFKKFYVPNNATLVVAGDFETAEAKQAILDYFGSIPRGADVAMVNIKEDPITETITDTAYDPNIQIPALVLAYRTPNQKERDAYVLDMIGSVLSDGRSSRLYKKMVDQNKSALQVAAFPLKQEDYGVYAVFALPLGETPLDQIKTEIDEEIERMKTELISEKEYRKLQNKFENRFVNANSSVEGIAGSLATYNMLYGNTNLINSEIEIYRSITRQELMDVAKKYLNVNQRLELEYLPEEKN